MSTVVLQVYDLSQGMARSMSRMILGKQIDGIWHTSVVVYGTEYFYGGGIASMPPKTTPYGYPVQELTMGQTTKSQAEFLGFLRRLSPRYSMEGYHILYHNCNNFTNDCLEFLLSTSLPAHIKDLPLEFLNTPLGKSMEPTISRLMQMTVGMGGSFGERVNTDDLISHEMIFAEGSLQNVTSHEQLHTTMKAEKAVLVYWEAEGVLEVSENINNLPLEFPGVVFACIDSARFPYLAPVNYPQIEIYENDIKTVTIDGYNLKAIRKALGGKARAEVKCEVLNWVKPRPLTTNWNTARAELIEQMKSGQLDLIDAEDMETLAKWARRGVVLNISEFVAMLVHITQKVDQFESAFELLAALAREPVSNRELSKQIGTGLPSLLSKASPSPHSPHFQLVFASNLATHSSGEALLKANFSAILPLLLSSLSSDTQSTQSAAASAFITIHRIADKGAFSLDNAQEFAAMLLDRLSSATEEGNVETIASALAMLVHGSEEMVGFVRELGVEMVEEKLEAEEKYRAIGRDLKAIWAAEQEE